MRPNGDTREKKRLTAPQRQTRRAPPPHQIPHFQRLILAHAERDAAGRVDVYVVDPARMTLERLEQGPVGRAEEGDGAVHRGGEEV